MKVRSLPPRASYYSLILIITLLIQSLTGCKSTSQGTATLGIINAHIWTGNPDQPWAEAIAIEGEVILLVGTSAEVAKLMNDSSKIIDAKGKMISPGFNDSHIHFIEGGFGLSSVQLRDAKTKEEFIERIGDFAKTIPAGNWILAGDWDHTNWGGELPKASWIDSVTPNHPVFVQRLDGHMGLANSTAMKLSKISSSTKDVDGGSITRDTKGLPDGIFKDNSMGLIYRNVSEPTDELKDRALEAAMDYVAERGVTSVHNMGTWGDLEVFKRAHKNKKLKTRIYAAVPLYSRKKLAEEVKKNGRGDDYLKIGGLKGFVDGSLGSHTAAFKQAFSDTPADSGFMVTSSDELYKATSPADSAGLQLLIHAIGDKAISELLNIFERVEKENGLKDRRFRIEHFQHIAPSDFSRVSPLKIIASVQPYHAIDDITTIAPEKIREVKVLTTIVGGKIVFQKGDK